MYTEEITNKIYVLVLYIYSTKNAL